MGALGEGKGGGLISCEFFFFSSRSRQTGISLITQVLYAVVFCTRYLDLFWTKLSDNKWNFPLKIFYISSSFYIIYLMMRVYARTREREKAWKLGAIALGGAMFAAPFVTLINKGTGKTDIYEVSGSDCSFRGWLVCFIRLLLNGGKYRSCGHSPSFWNRSAFCRSCFCYDKLQSLPSLIPSIF